MAQFFGKTLSLFRKFVKNKIGITHSVETSQGGERQLQIVAQDFSGRVRGQGTKSVIEETLKRALASNVTKKSGLMAEAFKMKSQYLYEQIINDLVNDVLYRNFEPGVEPYFKVEIDTPRQHLDLKQEILEATKDEPEEKEKVKTQTDNKKKDKGTLQLEEIANSAVRIFRIEEIVKDILPQLLMIGEYFSLIDYKDSQIDDSIPQAMHLSAFLRGQEDKVLSKPDSSTKYELKDPDNFLVFRLDPEKKKTNVKSKDKSYYYCHFGRPAIPPTLYGLINTIMLLEKIIPIAELQRVDKQKFMTLRVPSATNAEAAWKLAGEWQDNINAGRTDFNDVDNLISQIGSYKVIPVAGDKGDLESKDLPVPEPLDLDRYRELKRALSSAIPVPPENMGLEPDPDGKTNLRYLNLVKKIREVLAYGTRLFVFHYFKSRNRAVKLDRIHVKAPTVPGADVLQAIDYAVSLTDVLGSITSSIESISATIRDNQDLLDMDKTLALFNDKIRPLTGNREIFIKPPPPEDGEF